MKWWILLVALLGTLTFQAGCGDGMVRTHEDRMQFARDNLDHDMKQLIDDWDTFWLNDRKLRTTRWVTD